MKAKYLAKKGGKYRPIKLIDIVTLLHNLFEGVRCEQVGFEDANMTAEEIKLYLTKKKVWLAPEVIESALWSANLMDEEGKFWDVKERTFEDFLRSVLKNPRRFDRFYNFIKDKK
jgi:hypothetical protein